MLAYRTICIYVVLSLLGCLHWGGIPNSEAAGELSFDPVIGLTFGHDDNILFRRENPISDLYAKVQPEVRLARRTEVSTLNTAIRYQALRYIDESDFDSDKLSADLSGKYQGQERWSSSVNLSFNKDLTTDSYLEETGQVIDRSDRSLVRAGGNIQYLISNLSSAAIGYRYYKSDFEDQGFNDSESHTVTLTYFRRLKNEVDTIFVEPAYYFSQSDLQDVKDSSLSVGWQRQLTETFFSKVQVGARRSTVERNDGTEDDAWGVKALFELRYKSKLNNTIITYSHDLRTASNGRELTADNLYVKSSRLLTPRFGIGAGGRFVLSDKLSDEQDIYKTYYFQLQPYIFYSTTENSSISLSYRYLYNYDDAYEADESVDRNMVWIQFNVSWPIKC